jgi:alpha,alpha-trehalase
MTQTSVVSAAMTVPLFVNIASDTQAATVQHTLMNDLLKKGGVVTTTNTTSQQWDAPNGWAPLQFFAAIGMANYGFNDDATEIMQRFCTTVEDSFANTGALLEKYNVCVPTETAGGGEYDVQLGFGWTNGVYSYFKNALKG